MKICLRDRVTNKIGRVDPRPVPGKVGDAQWPVLLDQDAVGPHAVLLLETLDDLEPQPFFATWEAANRRLSVPPSGIPETRVAGTQDAWETLAATLQPDGLLLLYGVKTGVPMAGPFVFEVLE